jgi:ATP-dependent Lhr-like helicase
VFDLFSPPVRIWFAETFGEPTPPQIQGWPPIQRGEHTLILAPTGSGKTLAAFLWGIDGLLREMADPDAAKQPGIRIVYISPLKALNNDIQRNLRVPLAGIRKQAETAGIDLPRIEVAVRSGDTPQKERQSMLRRPPHILITTPESLYLMLTGTRSREIFRRVRTVIVDEIHTLAGSKRGVHLSLSLERLQHVARGPVQRIGLSATIQPLHEVARFLGGSIVVPATSPPAPSPLCGEGAGGEVCPTPGAEGAGGEVIPRPVTIVDAGYRKPLDLHVETVVDDFRNLAGGSIWPLIVPRLLALVRAHRTTLIFANNRRLAERCADWLNEQMAAEAVGQTTAMIAGGVAHGIGFMAAGRGMHARPIRAHHGSMSREARLEMERDLKEGRLPALVGTSSLELGIDIGAVDLVVQLQSPKSVAQGLQRVGRSGHLVGQTSRGRIFTTFREDVMEAAAVAGGMLRGAVEPTLTPRNPLDVLAQHIVAMVAVEPWDVDALYDLVRGAYAYQCLTPKVFRAVLATLSGRYAGAAHRELRGRIAWDQINNRIAALPGSRMLAVNQAGTIPDRGAYGAYLPDGKTRIGELDEEFVYETRIGDTFMLGSQVWRVTDITDDRVTVAAAPGAAPRMPFWRGDYPWRPYYLGRRVGEFRRAVAEKLVTLREMMSWRELREFQTQRDEPALQAILAWLQQDYALDATSAWLVLDYVAGQMDATGAISSDYTVVVEVFEDALGDPRMVVQSPFGGQVNGPWGLALASTLRECTGVEVEVQTSDDGILLRFPNSDGRFPLDLVARLGPAEARERILRELPDSAVFGSQFRQNAGRALLLPGLRGGKRTPFWLQRLRARDLLQVVRQFGDFPIVVETYRDCLEDVMDLPHLEEVLAGIQRGDIRLVSVETVTPSPVAQSLLWDFISIYMYEGDTPKAERQLQGLEVSRDLLQDLLKDVRLDTLLRPEAITEVRDQLQRIAPGYQVRSAEELALLLLERGDLSAREIAQAATVDPSPWVAQLAGQGRIALVDVPTAAGHEARWVAAEYADEYQAAFEASPHPPAPFPSPDGRGEGGEGVGRRSARSILERFLRHAGPLTQDVIRQRYAFAPDWLVDELERQVADRRLAHGQFTPGGPSASKDAEARDEYLDRNALSQIHRRTLTILRREVQPVSVAAYADFLVHWQHLHPAERLSGEGALRQVLQQLRAAPVVGPVWERDVLPLRLQRYDPGELAGLCRSGELIWVGSGGLDPRRGRVQFLFRGEGAAFLPPLPDALTGLTEAAAAVHALLKSEGALFLADICDGLGMDVPAAEATLTELVMAGLVTNDTLEALRRTVGRAIGTAPDRKPLSALEAQLAERRTLDERGIVPAVGLRRPEHARYQAAKRRVRERLAGSRPTTPAGPAAAGRWTLVHRLGVLGQPLPPEEAAARQARQLLARHGVVTAASLANEAGWLDWSPLHRPLNLMEMRGEVRRGYFVAGLPGVQFALPEVVERLRAAGGSAHRPDDPEPVVLNACDPANVYGATIDSGPQTGAGEPLAFARIPSTWLVLQRGWPVVLAEDTGARMTLVHGASPDDVRWGLEALLAHLITIQPRVTVTSWNGTPVLDSPGRPLLESLGLYRDYPGMTRERS